MDEQGNILGIVTKNDLYKAMSAHWFVEERCQFGLLLEDKTGSIKEVTDVISSYSARLVSILSSYEKAPEGYRHVYIRAFNIDRERTSELIDDLRQRPSCCSGGSSGKQERDLHELDHNAILNAAAAGIQFHSRTEHRVVG